MKRDNDVVGCLGCLSVFLILGGLCYVGHLIFNAWAVHWPRIVATGGLLVITLTLAGVLLRHKPSPPIANRDPIPVTKLQHSRPRRMFRTVMAILIGAVLSFSAWIFVPTRDGYALTGVMLDTREIVRELDILEHRDPPERFHRAFSQPRGGMHFPEIKGWVDGQLVQAQRRCFERSCDSCVGDFVALPPLDYQKYDELEELHAHWKWKMPSDLQARLNKARRDWSDRSVNHWAQRVRELPLDDVKAFVALSSETDRLVQDYPQTRPKLKVEVDEWYRKAGEAIVESLRKIPSGQEEIFAEESARAQTLVSRHTPLTQPVEAAREEWGMKTVKDVILKVDGIKGKDPLGALASLKQAETKLKAFGTSSPPWKELQAAFRAILDDVLEGVKSRARDAFLSNDSKKAISVVEQVLTDYEPYLKQHAVVRESLSQLRDTYRYLDMINSAANPAK